MKTHLFRILSPVLFGWLASLTLVLDTSARVFVSTTSTWRYFKGTSEASDPTNAWRELDFDDSTWLVGGAPFHFGTNAVGGDDDLTGGTILRRHAQQLHLPVPAPGVCVADTNTVRGLWLNAWFDDGLAVWINGQAARNPMGVSRLAHTTPRRCRARDPRAMPFPCPMRCRCCVRARICCACRPSTAA